MERSWQSSRRFAVAGALVFAGACGRPEGSPVSQTSSALTGARSFQITVPSGDGIDQIVLAANGVLRLQPRANISGNDGALVTNAGSTESSVGNDSNTTSIDSVSPVTLGN